MGKKAKRKEVLEKEQSSREETRVKEKTAAGKIRKKQALQKLDKPNRLLTGLAVAGMLLTAYLTITAWLDQPPLYCDKGSSCDIIQRSRWGTFLALPTAFWGFLIYAALGHIGFRVRNRLLHWKSAWTVSMAGLGYSVYLMVISLFVIKAACAYCIVSFLIMAVIFAVVTFQRPKELPGFNFTAFAGQTVIITAVLISGMHLHYSGVFDPAAGPEDPYLKGLAEHLTQDKAVLYGAYW